LNEIVEHVVAQEQTLARHHKITIERDLSGNVPDLRVDKRAFERVATNLLGNAVKFSSRGARICVATARRGDEVVFSVSDQGPGIPLEEREKLFKRYSQAAGPAKKDGSGLGLFIVKTITEAHGGRVSVECPPGGGSVFEVILPASAAEALTGAEAATG
jgi:signal transduction histidine kinase